MESESIALLMFVLWWWFNRWWMVGGGVLHKVFIGPAQTASFLIRILAEAMNMTHMLHRLDISTFYFNDQLLLQIFFRPL